MSDLRERLEKAADLTKGLPEALQADAFKLAFTELSSGAVLTPAIKNRPGNRAGTRRRPAAPQVSPARSRRRAGPKAAVEELIDRGFLADPKGIDEIRQELDLASGQRFTLKAIATSVLRLLRERRLSRDRGDDGNYRYRAA